MRRASPLRTILTDARKEDVGVVLKQKVVDGPEAMLDRNVNLLLPTPQDGLNLAIRILKELVPYTALKTVAKELKQLAESANE